MASKRSGDAKRHNDGARRGAGAGATAPLWLGTLMPADAELTEVERDTAWAALCADLMTGRAPVPRGPDGEFDPARRPRLIFAIGAPGSGKSTLTQQLAAIQAKHGGPGADTYIDFDYDLLVKYHPRARGIWPAPDITGRPTDVGYAMGWAYHIEAMVDMGHTFVERCMDMGYNITVQTHDVDLLAEAQRRGYHCTLLCVGATLATAQRRARERAAETGRFLAHTLAEQDDHVATLWARYQARAASLAPLADDVYVVANDRDGARADADFRRFDPHPRDEDWRATLRRIDAAVAAAHGQDAAASGRAPPYGRAVHSPPRAHTPRGVAVGARYAAAAAGLSPPRRGGE